MDLAVEKLITMAVLRELAEVFVGGVARSERCDGHASIIYPNAVVSGKNRSVQARPTVAFLPPLCLGYPAAE
jgi:hypothetical protein